MVLRRRDLRQRAQKFALRVIRHVAGFPRCSEGFVLGKQVIRSATSIGANYVEASAARSRGEFRSQVMVALRECRETVYWLELIKGSRLGEKEETELLIQESQELAKILATIAIKCQSK